MTAASLYYFVGGPVPGASDEFFARLASIGGTPRGWRVYPHVAGDGRALHFAPAVSREEILEHLAHFVGIYEHGDIIEISEVLQPE